MTFISCGYDSAFELSAWLTSKPVFCSLPVVGFLRDGMKLTAARAGLIATLNCGGERFQSIGNAGAVSEAKPATAGSPRPTNRSAALPDRTRKVMSKEGVPVRRTGRSLPMQPCRDGSGVVKCGRLTGWRRPGAICNPAQRETL
jgi:hypothetical protein